MLKMGSCYQERLLSCFPRKRMILCVCVTVGKRSALLVVFNCCDMSQCLFFSIPAFLCWAAVVDRKVSIVMKKKRGSLQPVASLVLWDSDIYKPWSGFIFLFFFISVRYQWAADIFVEQHTISSHLFGALLGAVQVTDEIDACKTWLGCP